MTEHNHPIEDTSFEQKLAAYRPRLLREIELPTCDMISDSLRTTPTVSELLNRLVQSWQACERKVRPQIVTCLCCFLLGALTMFVLMTWYFDGVPTRWRPSAANNTSAYSAYKVHKTVIVPFQVQDLDGVSSPADLMTRIRRQPVIPVKPALEARSEEFGVRSYYFSDRTSYF